MRLVNLLFAALVTSILLGGCGASTAQIPTTQPSVAVVPSTQATSIATPVAPTSVPTAVVASATTLAASVPTVTQPMLLISPTPAASTQATGQTGESALVAKARNTLLTQPGLGQQTLTLQSEKDVEWPTSALGCPESGKAYLQVITPGVQIIFSDGARTYDIHTGRAGDPLIWCDNGTPKVIGASK